MNNLLELLGASSQWGQSSNARFFEYIIGEKRHLKAELQSFKNEAEKSHQKIRDELV